MRVLLDARMDIGGVGRYGSTLRAGLRDLPDGPEVVVIDRLPAGPRRLAAAPYTPWGRALVARSARVSAADIVHNLSFEAPPVPVPLVVAVHDVIPIEHPASMPSPLRRAEFRRVVATTLRRADAVIVPSERTAAAIRNVVGVPGCRLAVVPYAVDPVFRPATDAERATARRRFAGGRRYVAAVTTARAHKNLDGVLALGRALAGRGDVEVVVRGPSVTASAPALVVGPLRDEDLRMLYAGADVALVCSHVEGYGLPAVEAAACGTPVVCGPGIGALSVLAGAATVADVGDPASVAGAIACLLDDQRAAAASRAAGLAAAARLTPAVMAAATVEVYREVLT